MTDTTKHLGWANRQTWLVNLWLNNEHGIYEAACAIARTHPKASALWTGETIRSEVIEPMIPDTLDATMLRDLIDDALDCADWAEIGAAFLESVES